MIAVIKTGGKQYMVSENSVISVEKLEGEAGSSISFPDVLFVGDEKDVSLGAPVISSVKVEAEIVSQTRDDKKWGIKHKAKKRYKMKFGHRQPLTEVKITKISV
ncbi:MAG: 50S ribosomal protein L21 [Candidatus Moranbacteria bacterium]|nr:50S ribosomal protein L21 [Candidatus Moranbacteria bacterium]